MPKGRCSKATAKLDSIPDNTWWWICKGETIKTSCNKKTFDMWVRLHLKKCSECKKIVNDMEQGTSNVYLKADLRVTQSNQIRVANTGFI